MLLGSRRIRGLLSLGIIAGIGGVGTLAYWTDDAAVTTGSFTAGTLDVTINDALAGPANNGGTTSDAGFALADMVPGESVARTVKVGNAGTIPLAYTAKAWNSGGLASGLRWTAVAGSTASNSGHRRCGQPQRIVLVGHDDRHQRDDRDVGWCGDHRRQSGPNDQHRCIRERVRDRQGRCRCRQRATRNIGKCDDPGQRGAAAMTRVREIVLTTGAILGVICLLWVAMTAIIGVKPLVVTSGSMEPAISTGDVALSRPVPAGELRVGDVASVISPDGVRVMHRVVDARSEGEQYALTLKGDANRSADDMAYRASMADRVFLTIPRGGYVISAVTSRLGQLCGGLVVAGLIVLAFGPGGARPRGGRRRAEAVALVLVVAAVGAGARVAPAQTARAAFTDAPSLTTGSFAAHTVVRPDSVSCSAALLSATISWPSKDPRYDYEAVLRRVSTGNVVSTRQITGNSISTTYSGLLDFGLVVGAGTVDFTVEIRSKLATATSWESATTRNYGNIRVLAIVIGATASCTT